MCGRYYLADDTAKELYRITGREEKPIRTGDVFPSDKAPLLVIENERPVLTEMTWGFSGYQGKNLLINARAEGLLDKKTFRENALTRRCIIPAKGFYEWTPQKEKYQFEDNSPALYMAGCYNLQGRFVIITTAANASVSPVHDRMPLLLSLDELQRWLMDADSIQYFLGKTPMMLKRWTKYQQLSLFC